MNRLYHNKLSVDIERWIWFKVQNDLEIHKHSQIDYSIISYNGLIHLGYIQQIRL